MLSIVIPAFNRWGLTRACMEQLVNESIAGAITLEPFIEEIILVDNGSTDDTRHAQADVVIRNAKNRGFAHACNQGVGVASSEIVLLLNNDTVPGDLSAMIEAFQDPDVDIAGCRIIRPDGSVDHTGVLVDFSRPPGLEATHRTMERPTGRVEAVTGACMAVRKDWFQMVGGMDEGFWNGYEDVDLCLRAEGRVQYVAETTIVHLISQSGPERWSATGRNIERLRKKWGGDECVS